MALFNFGKKKEERKTPTCCCGSAAPQAKKTGSCCKSADSIRCVKVLGTGCKACHQQHEYAKEAVSSLGLSVEVEYITDIEKILSYGVMSMPAIVVNDKVAAAGKVLRTKDVEKLLKG